MLQSAEIRSHTKGRHELKIEPKTIYNEICKVYGDNEVSFMLVRNLIGKLNSDIDSIKDTYTYCRSQRSVAF